MAVSRRFRGRIDQAGVNPYVDVPQRVSRAFAPWARGGRVRVAGTLNGVPVRATLVPVGQGRHRLYVNGGMRAAAGVGVGDLVSLVLRPTGPDEVELPADVAAALADVAGVQEAFAALAPSHRRELLRYVDDARTPQTRTRRIGRLVDHALGRAPASAPTGTARRGLQRQLWTCPRCGNAFVTRNQYHSCARHEVDESFVGKPPGIRELFERFRAMVEACGPVTVVAYRDRVGFMARVRFAGATPRRRWLEIGFWLPRRLDSPRIDSVETIYPDAHVHRLRIMDTKQLDAELAGWLAEAYAVGRQEHLRGRGD